MQTLTNETCLRIYLTVWFTATTIGFPMQIVNGEDPGCQCGCQSGNQACHSSKSRLNSPCCSSKQPKSTTSCCSKQVATERASCCTTPVKEKTTVSPVPHHCMRCAEKQCGQNHPTQDSSTFSIHVDCRCGHVPSDFCVLTDNLNTPPQRTCLPLCNHVDRIAPGIKDADSLAEEPLTPPPQAFLI